MAEKLRDSHVRRLAAPATGNKIYYDSELRGFGVRVTAAGSRSFILNFFINGRERRITLGQYPAWSVAQAREAAARHRRGIDVGADPLAAREKAFADPTVTQLIGHFLKDHVAHKNRPGTQTLYTRSLEDYAQPRIGNLKVNAVSFSDIAQLHLQVTRENGPYAANRTAAVLSKMFNMAVRWGYRADNPAKGIERNQEAKRERYLSPEELAWLAKKLRAFPEEIYAKVDRRKLSDKGKAEFERKRAIRQQSANAIRYALLTGARIGEVLSAEWDHLDLDGGVWTKPAAATKQKKTHRVPLSSAAIEVLRDVKASQDEGERFVFPGAVPGKHQTECKTAWASIKAAAAKHSKEKKIKPVLFDGVRLHDLRHNYASQLASAGLSLPIIGALLGHTQAATTARYAHLLDDPLRAATEHVSALYKGAQGTPKAEVVPIRGRA